MVSYITFEYGNCRDTNVLHFNKLSYFNNNSNLSSFLRETRGTYSKHELFPHGHAYTISGG